MDSSFLPSLPAPPPHCPRPTPGNDLSKERDKEEVDFLESVLCGENLFGEQERFPLHQLARQGKVPCVEAEEWWGQGYGGAALRRPSHGLSQPCLLLQGLLFRAHVSPSLTPSPPPLVPIPLYGSC